jgi:hypothetical protein
MKTMEFKPRQDAAKPALTICFCLFLAIIAELCL